MTLSHGFLFHCLICVARTKFFRSHTAVVKVEQYWTAQEDGPQYDVGPGVADKVKYQGQVEGLHNAVGELKGGRDSFLSQLFTMDIRFKSTTCLRQIWSYHQYGLHQYNVYIKACVMVLYPISKLNWAAHPSRVDHPRYSCRMLWSEYTHNFRRI